jgi:hypothetical protein
MMSFKISATCLSLGADKITKKRAYEILKSVKKRISLNNRLQAILDNLVKYYDATFARIWFVDKDRKWLILKFRSGKSKNIDEEFLRVLIETFFFLRFCRWQSYQE